MKMMLKSIVLAAVLSFTAVLGAQEFPNEPYDFLMAKLSAEEGRYDDALERMGRVIEKNPGNPVLLYERAMILIDAGRVERAEEELRAVVKANPDFHDAYRVLGRVILDRSGPERTRMTEALGYLQTAYKLNPDDLSTGMVVAQILMSMDRLAEAERILATMIERAPDQRGLNYNYAQVLTKLGRGNESKPYLERAVTIDPTFGPAIMQLLDMYQEENEWQKAADLLAPLIAEEPMNLEMQRQQAWFLLRAGAAVQARDRFKALVAADAKDTRSLFFLGEALNDLGEYAEAEKAFRQVLAMNATDADALGSLGLSLSGQKKWDEASKTFNTLLGMGNVSEGLTALARTQLAAIDIQKGNFEAAVATAKSAFVFKDKPNTQAINIALQALRQQNKPNEALALLEPLAKQFDQDPFVNARYIEALIRAGQKEKAQEQAALQAKLGTRNAIAAAEAYVQADDLKSAIALMKSAAAARPAEVDLQFELGSVYERSGDRPTAEKTFLAVLDKNPDHAPTLNYLGYMWAEGGVHLEKAHEMLTRAVGQEPTNGAYIDSLGWVYFRLGNLELAEKYLTDATRLMPHDPTVYEHLGDVLAKRGDTTRALAVYRTAVNIDPQSKDAEKIRMKIAEIERKTQTSER